MLTKIKDILDKIGYINIFYFILGIIVAIRVDATGGCLMITIASIFMFNDLQSRRMDVIDKKIKAIYDLIESCIDREGQLIDIVKDLNARNTELRKIVLELEKEVKED